MEKVWASQRLEHRSRTQIPHGERRAHKHPRFYRRHQIPRVQVSSWELCTARQWPQGNSRKGPLRRWRSVEITSDGHLREEKGKELFTMGRRLQGW